MPSVDCVTVAKLRCPSSEYMYSNERMKHPYAHVTLYLRIVHKGTWTKPFVTPSTNNTTGTTTYAGEDTKREH